MYGKKEERKKDRTESLFDYELVERFLAWILDGLQIILKSLVGIIFDHGGVGAKRCEVPLCETRRIGAGEERGRQGWLGPSEGRAHRGPDENLN